MWGIVISIFMYSGKSQIFMETYRAIINTNEITLLIRIENKSRRDRIRNDTVR